MAKSWAWSFTKKTNYDICPKRYYHLEVAKDYAEDKTGEQLTYGKAVHEALDKACSKGEPLPKTLGFLQHWVDLVREWPGEIKTELQYAVTRDFKPTEWFAPNVWFRGICDLLMTSKDKVAVAWDWKTGKVKHNSQQLMIMSTCIMVHNPEIEKVKTRFVWLQDNCTTPEEFDRKNLSKEWSGLIPEINAMEQAHKTLTFPPKPGGMCMNYCPVTSCPFYKKPRG